MNKINYVLSTVLLLFATVQLSAQENFTRCYSHEYQQILNELHPGFNKAVNETFEQAKAANHYGLEKNDSILRIPVVVHIIHFTEEQNLPDYVVHSQIEVLNEDYRRMNADASLTRDIFAPCAGDAGIEFYLANVDPDGLPTTGITRTATDVASFGIGGGGGDITDILADIQAGMDECGITFIDLLSGALTPEQEACFNNILLQFTSLDLMKFDESGGHDAWPTDRYLNIWVCDMASPTLPGAILGFAYPPVGAPNWPAGSSGTAETDGVVIQYQALGRDNPTPGFMGIDRGRTGTHEVGHYLGLRHIWGDGDCTMDDGIADTPVAATASQQTCDYTKNECVDEPIQCTGQVIDYPDMIEDFMDYSTESCMNMFTHGQIDIMRSMLLGPRSGLLSALELPAPVADFQADVTNVLPGEEIQFSDLSFAANTWYWTFGDGASSAEQHPIHSYDMPGIYTVSLSVDNSVGFDFLSKEAYIVVEESVGIDQTISSENITIAPNPTKGMLNITMDIAGSAMATVEVYNIAGRRILMEQTVNRSLVLDLSQETAGLYLVKIVVDGQVMTEKVLLER